MATKKKSVSDIQDNNLGRVYNLTYQSGRISRTEIARQLNLSLPTVSENLKQLEQTHLIERNGVFQSTGGRKSIAYTCVSNARVAIGTQISEHHIRIAAIDLFGRVIKRTSHEYPYVKSPEYYQQFGRFVNGFCQTLNISSQRILGVGIAIKGLLSHDSMTVMQGVRLGSAGVTLSDFASHLDYPCHLVHDVEAAAEAEIWFSPQIVDAVYVSLSYDLGGALILQGQVHRGKEYRGGLLEHMCLYPNGRKCYCGNSGCVSTYCSARVLLSEEFPTFEYYFQRLRDGDGKAAEIWTQYLSHLAVALGSMHMLLDCDIILGGSIVGFLTIEDIRILQKLIRGQSIFAPASDFIRIGHIEADVFACGAALPYIREFLPKH